jgi:hypothetical protein
MSMMDKKTVWAGQAICLGLGLAFLGGCADMGIPVKDLRVQTQGGARRAVEQVFATNRPVVALIDNKKGILFAATDAGDIFKLSGVNQAERIVLGRDFPVCADSWRAFTLSREGELVTNTCRGGKDMLVTVALDGTVKDLASVNGHVLALANDSRGTLYAATWLSEGNVSISLNPRALAGAEFILGKIFELPTDGSSNVIHDGSIPVWIATSRRDFLYASLWGAKGYFAPDKKSYQYVDPYRAYWLALSDRIQFVNFTERKPRFENTVLSSLSLFLIPEDDYLIGYGIDHNGAGGLFLVEENRPPVKVLFQEKDADKNITSLALYQDVVYFGNVDGIVYRIK